MRYSRTIFVFIFFLLPNSWAGKCYLEKFFNDPALRNNTEFWLGIVELRKAGKYNDFHVQKLIEKFGGKSESPSFGDKDLAPQRPNAISFKKDAQKEIDKLPPNLKNNLDDFSEIASRPGGLSEFYKNPGRWHLEDISENSHEKVMSVRLNGGYRVKFSKSDDGITVLMVNKGKVHDHKK